MRVLVCGGRLYANRAKVDHVLDSLHKESPITLIIHGGAKGADRLAMLWAIAKGIKHQAYYPDWKAHGFAAGPIRNAQMYERSRPHLVVAFPGNKGTAHMVRYAKSRKAKVNVQLAVSKHHRRISPHCPATRMDLKLPHKFGDLGARPLQ